MEGQEYKYIEYNIYVTICKKELLWATLYSKRDAYWSARAMGGRVEEVEKTIHYVWDDDNNIYTY